MPLPKNPQPRIQIQAVEPIVDCGRYPVKRTVGDAVEVYATVVKDGHDTLAGAVRVKAPGERTWREEPLRSFGSDRRAFRGTEEFLHHGWTQHGKPAAREGSFA